MSIRAICFLTVALFFASIPSLFSPVTAQKDKQTKQASAPSLTRTIARHETQRLAYGGTVTIVGAPSGSITVEGWQRNEVDISAEITLSGPTERDLDLLAAVNNFAVDVDANHVRLLTTGAHDKKFLKSVARNFPKYLIGLPWKIDYQIKVPASTDLEINAGNGPVKLGGVEGAIRMNALESNTELSLTGGNVFALIQSGTVNVSIATLSWRGLGAEVKVASGSLTVEIPGGFNGDINADVLRLGEVKNAYPNLEPRERNSISARSMRARAGSGGGTLSFTVGDGVILIRQAKEQ